MRKLLIAGVSALSLLLSGAVYAQNSGGTSGGERRRLDGWWERRPRLVRWCRKGRQWRCRQQLLQQRHDNRPEGLLARRGWRELHEAAGAVVDVFIVRCSRARRTTPRPLDVMADARERWQLRQLGNPSGSLRFVPARGSRREF